MNNDIISLLGERVEKFTMRDSTSVTKETAERITKEINRILEEEVANKSQPPLKVDIKIAAEAT